MFEKSSSAPSKNVDHEWERIVGRSEKLFTDPVFAGRIEEALEVFKGLTSAHTPAPELAQILSELNSVVSEYLSNNIVVGGEVYPVDNGKIINDRQLLSEGSDAVLFLGFISSIVKHKKPELFLLCGSKTEDEYGYSSNCYYAVPTNSAMLPETQLSREHMMAYLDAYLPGITMLFDELVLNQDSTMAEIVSGLKNAPLEELNRLDFRAAQKAAAIFSTYTAEVLGNRAEVFEASYDGFMDLGGEEAYLRAARCLIVAETVGLVHVARQGAGSGDWKMSIDGSVILPNTRDEGSKLPKTIDGLMFTEAIGLPTDTPGAARGNKRVR